MGRLRATSIRHENRRGNKSNYQSDYYGHNEHDIKQQFIKEFNSNLTIVWAKLYDEQTGRLLLELEAM